MLCKMPLVDMAFNLSSECQLIFVWLFLIWVLLFIVSYNMFCMVVFLFMHLFFFSLIVCRIKAFNAFQRLLWSFYFRKCMKTGLCLLVLLYKTFIKLFSTQHYVYGLYIICLSYFVWTKKWWRIKSELWPSLLMAWNKMTTEMKKEMNHYFVKITS